MRKKKRSLVCEPFDKVKGKMRELKITQLGLSKELNISIVTLNKKLNGSYSFSWDEMDKLIEILGISENEIAEYFFADVLRKRNKGA